MNFENSVYGSLRPENTNGLAGAGMLLVHRSCQSQDVVPRKRFPSKDKARARLLFVLCFCKWPGVEALITGAFLVPDSVPSGRRGLVDRLAGVLLEQTGLAGISVHPDGAEARIN